MTYDGVAARQYNVPPDAATTCGPSPIAEIERHGHEIGKMLEELEQRLGPVLVPISPTLMGGAAKEPPVNRLREAMALMNQVKNHLASIMGRIDL